MSFQVETYDRRIRDLLEPWIYEWTAVHRGSISAEHGIGVMKADCIHFSKSKDVIATMRAIKDSLDPRGILNPYKLFPHR